MIDPSVGLGFGGFGTGVKCIELLLFIVKTTQEAHQLKDECIKVGTAATTLKSVLDGNKAALKDAKTESLLERTLLEVADFAIACRNKNILRRSWEIIWTKRLPALLKEMEMWVTFLNTEVSVMLRGQMMTVITAFDDIETRRETDTAAILDKLEKLELQDELKKAEREDKSSKIHVDFPEDDARLSVSWTSGSLKGKLCQRKGTGAELDVICELVDESLYDYGQGSRHAFIYERLTARTLVHPFYGIAQRDGKKWAVMKDLSHCDSLADAIRNGKLPKGLPERLGMVIDIVRTLEYLHSVKVVVKILSDSTVILCDDEDGFTPYLTSLDKSRLFIEHSIGAKYDERYEAPELQSRKSRRDEYSDIWSLGVLIWSCTTATLPFATEAGQASHTPDIKQTRAAVASNRMPWTNKTYDDPSLNQVLRLVKLCCTPMPETRLSAAQVAEHLRSIQSLVLRPLVSTIPNPEELKDRVAARLADDTESSQLSEPDVLALRLLTSRGDGYAAYLLGSAIQQDRAPPDDDVEQLLHVSKADGLKERRFRSALTHLETAMKAGIKPAAKVLMDVHYDMSELYQSQAQQYRDLESLRK